MKRILVSHLALVTSLFIFSQPFKVLSSQYTFLFHHYNDISSYSQIFFLPTQTRNMFSLRMDAFQSSNKNVTLLKDETASNILFDFGFKPCRDITLKIKEKTSNNILQAESYKSRIAKNELRIETILEHKTWLRINPYFLFSNDHYVRQFQNSVDIKNPGVGKGIMASADIKDLGYIASELSFLDQSLNSDKKASITGTLEKDYSNARIGGNFEGKNTLTHYPILNGKEEKFFESVKGVAFTEFSLFNRLTTYLSFERRFRNEIYTLLSGYSGKHNNEKTFYNNFFQTFSYTLNSRISIDLNLNEYNGEKTFQDGLNDENSTVKNFAPAICFKPNINSEIKLKRIIRLSSFSFPNPFTVTDRDVLDKSVMLLTRYLLPGGTDVSISLMRTLNHIIFVKSEMSANNVRRTKYNVEMNIKYFVHRSIEIDEVITLSANYQLYDFSSERNLFTRSFSNDSEICILKLPFFQPSFAYKIMLQDWGPYLLSYDSGNYLYYRSLESKKEAYRLSSKIFPNSSVAFTPSYEIKKNTFRNLNQVAGKQESSLIEGHYGLKLTYRNSSTAKIDFHFTLIKRNSGNDFYELKTKLTYGV